MSFELRRLAVRGLMSLRDVELKPGRVTVLIGPNGAGKSNLLTAFELLAHLHAGTLRRFVAERGPASALLHYGPKQTPAIEVEAEFARGDAIVAYQARLAHAPGDDGFVFTSESVSERLPSSRPTRPASLGSGHRESRLESGSSSAMHFSLHGLSQPRPRQPRNLATVIGTDIRAALAELRHFHFHDTSSRASLRLAAREADARALHADGGNLAPFLLTLAESAPGSPAHNAWRRINHLAGRVAPAIKALAPTRVGRDSVRLDWFDDRGELFGPARLSDGTLRAIALITALAQPEETRPGFISIDEPELGLHPAALAVLAGLVRAVAPTSQVLLATQSPALLDHFKADEVLVTERHDGESCFRRLDVPSLQAWLDDYRLSELYDRNILGGRP